MWGARRVGMGWRAAIAISAAAWWGDLDFATDDLNGPWERLVRERWTFYPVGFGRLCVSRKAAGRPDSLPSRRSTWTFGGVNRVLGSGGK